MLTPMASDPAAAALQKQKDVTKAGLQKACTEFESLFITHMLKSMRATVDKDGLIGNSNESQIMQSMFDENLALGVARGGGIGLAEILFKHFEDL